MRNVIVFGLLLFMCLSVSAQSKIDEFAKSKEMLQLLKEGKGKELHNMLDVKAQALVPAEQLNGMWESLVKLYGACEAEGQWKRTTLMGQELQFVDLKFNVAPLRFLTSFDKDGKANTMRLMPVPK